MLIDFLCMELRLSTCEYDWKRLKIVLFSILWKKRRNMVLRTSPTTTRAKNLKLYMKTHDFFLTQIVIDGFFSNFEGVLCWGKRQMFRTWR
jgi:hypothetical protein